MNKLSDDKLNKLKALDDQGGFWYITKQNLIFRDLCYMAKILEAWGDSKEENYQSFFDSHKTMPEYGELPPLTAHRATKNCEYIGLTIPSDKYSAQKLTPFYFALKEACNGDFNKLSSYPKVIDKQLERMFIDSRKNNTYTVNFQICPFMFLFKVLLLIGDITKSYKISTSEFKLFVATAQSWNEYFEVVESIIRYRNDREYRAQCDQNSSKTADVRYNVLAQNHSQLDVTSNEIAIRESEIKNVRRKVAEYELSEQVQTSEDIYSAISLVSEPNQVIYFGAPGTGKSHTVKAYTKNLPEGNVFRTTFHPDSDYSTFVGSYKPSMRPAVTKQTILDYDSLVDKFKDYLSADSNITRACTKFGFDYHDSIVKMQENNAHTIPVLVADAYKSGTTYDTQVRSGMSVYETSHKETGADDKIIYSFIPQAFTKAYIRAWQTDQPVFLVIEEINRGNCAQIFGDLFQLLDRKNNISEYPIKPDTDLGSYIHSEFKKNGCAAPEDSAIYKGEELCLPANLYIWATMNTSDQSLFPIDSAFKRRWEWRYIKIAKPTDKETGKPFDWHIEGDTDWWLFLKKINAIINKMTSSADKQLGYFFAKADAAGEIKYDRFVAKVCFYLWNDIFKTYAMDDVETDLFKFTYDEDGQTKTGKLNFTEFFDEDGKVVPGIVQQFIGNVMNWNDNTKQE